MAAAILVTELAAVRTQADPLSSTSEAYLTQSEGFEFVEVDTASAQKQIHPLLASLLSKEQMRWTIVGHKVHGLNLTAEPAVQEAPNRWQAFPVVLFPIAAQLSPHERSQEILQDKALVALCEQALRRLERRRAAGTAGDCNRHQAGARMASSEPNADARACAQWSELKGQLERRAQCLEVWSWADAGAKTGLGLCSGM